METHDHCPECGSREVRATVRKHPVFGEIAATVCDVCHWASDPRIGRPPADRGKNYTLRRLVAEASEDDDADLTD
jgi:hypothetical protein